jgi:hypothetical protein
MSSSDRIRSVEPRAPIRANDLVSLFQEALGGERASTDSFMIEIESMDPPGDGARVLEIGRLLAIRGAFSPNVTLSPGGRLLASFKLRAESSFEALQSGVGILDDVLKRFSLERDYRCLRAYPTSKSSMPRIG